MENQTNGTIEVAERQVPTAVETALYLITKAEIDNQIATAKAFPRSIKQFMDKAESIATVTEEVAASCNYALPRAGKTIEGPSVRLAEIIVSAYGNIRAGARVIDNDGRTITAQGICHDLENNNCVTVEVKRRITGKDGRTLSEDMQVVIGNAACAVAFRNAVFKVIPAALIEPVYEKTKEVAKGKAETMVARRNKAVEYAKSIGITEEQICEKLLVKKIEDIDLDKLATFRAILTGIKNGESTVQDVFAKAEDETQESKELNRMLGLINKSKTIEKLNTHKKDIPQFSESDQKVLNEAFLDKLTELEKEKEESK